MSKNIKILDPVQGLIDYVNDIKPYHSKIIESLIEYVSIESVAVTMLEAFHFEIHLVYGFESPPTQTYIASGLESGVINATIPIRSGIIWVGSPAYPTTDSFGTTVYKNGQLQTEQYGSPLVGDYSINVSSGQIIFANYFTERDVIIIHTVSKSHSIQLLCPFEGFGISKFDDPSMIPVISPDRSQSMIDYGAITSNSVIVSNDRRQQFDSSVGLTFTIDSFIENRIVSVVASSGSPLTGGAFTISGNMVVEFSIGTIFEVTGTLYNDGIYRVTNVAVSGSPQFTEITVDGYDVSSIDVGGFIKTPSVDNNGTFSVISSIFTRGTSLIDPYTTVFISGITLIQPDPTDYNSNQRYISYIGLGDVQYKRILSYSNNLQYYGSSPIQLTQTPDEGIVYAPIVNLSQGSPTYFVVAGNVERSNIFVGDEFSVSGSTDNNTSYIIDSLEYIFEPLINDYATKIGVASIHNAAIDGNAIFDIPSNVFILDDDYTKFFKQGVVFEATSGSCNGKYNTLYSKYVNGETRIRVREDVVTRGTGRLIYNTTDTPSNGFIVIGNSTTAFKTGNQFIVTTSVSNSGVYTASTDSIFSALTNTTTIYVTESIDATDSTGEITPFSPGILTPHIIEGFAITPDVCEAVPETLVAVGITDTLSIDNISIWTTDEVFVYGTNASTSEFDLPDFTIFAAEAPTVVVSSTVPVSPVDNMLWFDTSKNTESITGPGIFKQYTVLTGSPSVTWNELPFNKAYWIDTDTNYMYYRTVYQYYDPDSASYPVPSISNNMDTEWVLLFEQIPGINALILPRPAREEVAVQRMFTIPSATGAVETSYSFTTPVPTIGSPAVPDASFLEVYVNDVQAQVSMLSTTRFMIISPNLRIDDLIKVKSFVEIANTTSEFIGAFDSNATIDEDFDLLKGYKFKIVGSESVGSPLVNSIYIADPDTSILNIIKPFTGSPETRVLADTVFEISGSAASPNFDGNYNILDASQFATGSPVDYYCVLTVTEPVLTSGFLGSPQIDSGFGLFQQWFQYMIISTTSNTVVVYGDATGDLLTGSPTTQFKILHSLGSPNNDGTYSVVSSVFDGTNTTITTVEVLINTGNSGGWVESV